MTPNYRGHPSVSFLFLADGEIGIILLHVLRYWKYHRITQQPQLHFHRYSHKQTYKMPEKNITGIEPLQITAVLEVTKNAVVLGNSGKV